MIAKKKTIPNNYRDLENLFTDWRSFENPVIYNGAPDYRKSQLIESQKEYESLKTRLYEIDTTKWPFQYQVDWNIVLAEMNGYDFNYRILKPWERDPAFYQTVWMYQSDVPAHEGPTNHGVLEFWTYDFPLSKDEEKRLEKELLVIPPLLSQARENLTGNAKDLWVAGIENFKSQNDDLDVIRRKVGNVNQLLVDAIKKSQSATNEFLLWLEGKTSSKTGHSGVGKENYTWYQQNVHLIPMTWEEEVELLKKGAEQSLELFEIRRTKKQRFTKNEVCRNS